MKHRPIGIAVALGVALLGALLFLRPTTPSESEARPAPRQEPQSSPRELELARVPEGRSQPGARPDVAAEDGPPAPKKAGRRARRTPVDGPPGRIEGIVLPAAGQVGGRLVDATHFGDDPGRSTRTDDAGKFVFEGLPEGDWLVQLPVNLEKYSSVQEIDEWELVESFVGSNSVHVEVSAGQTTYVEIGAFPSGSVRVWGTARSAGVGLADAVVNAIDETGGWGGQYFRRTDEHGVYELIVRTPGTYTFAIGSERGQRTRYAGVEVPERSELQLDFDIPTSSIRGLLLDEAGSPVSGESVYATLPDSAWSPVEPRWTTSDEDGSFGFDHLAAGLYVVRAGGASDWYEERDAPRYARALSPSFELREGESRDDLSLVLQAPGTLRGRVTRASSGKPEAHAQVIVCTPEGVSFAAYADVVAGKNGRFAYPGLPSGEWFVQALGEETQGERAAVVLRAGEVTQVQLEVP